MVLSMSMDQYICSPLGLEGKTVIHNHTAHRTFPASRRQFDFLPSTLKILKIPLGEFLFPPNDSTNVSFFRSVFFLLKMEIFPNNFSQFSCLSRYCNLKHPLDCLAHISHPVCDHLGANLQVS